MLNFLTLDVLHESVCALKQWPDGDLLGETLKLRHRHSRKNLRTQSWPNVVASVASQNWFVLPDNYTQSWLIPYAAVSGAIAVEVGDLMYDYGSSLDVAYPAGQQASQSSEAADQVLFASGFCGCSLDKVLSTETNAARRIAVMTSGVKVFDCPSQAWVKGDLIGIYSDGALSPISQKVDKVTTVDKAIGVCVKGTLGVAATTVTAFFMAKNYTGQKMAGTTLGDVTLNSIAAGDASFDVAGITAAQGGSITLTGGTSSTAGNAGGAVAAVGGTPGVTGVGGAVTFTGGAGGATSGVGGAASIIAGAGTAGNSAGGVAQTKGGAGQGSAAGGIGKVLGGAGGATGAGGAAQVTGGAGGATSGAGGAVTLTGGAGTASNSAGGAAQLVGGAGSGSSAGGAITITSGAAGATGVAGAVNISVGGATAGNGSAVTITGGAGAGGTASGGNVNLVGGAAVSTGAPGEVQVNADANLFFVQVALTATDASRPVFIANRAMRLKTVNFQHTVGSTSGTLQIEKLTGTTAAGSGTVLLTGTIDLSATTVANTVTAGTLIATVASLTFAAGDRVSIKIAGTMTNLVNGIVTLGFVPV